MTDFKRVYHPTLDSWKDVPAEAVDEWAEAGWRKTPGKHHTTEGLPGVGEHPGFAEIPVEIGPAPEEPVTPRARSGAQASPRSARTSSSSRPAGGSKAARGAAATASPTTSGGTSSGATTV